ncbi:MAG: hypothetical protein AAB353_01215 [Candidatus Hydrogenedentota bacterium]
MQRATLAIVLVAVTTAWAANTTGPVTFTKDVLPILQENCQTCHRPAGINMSGMVAPMSLITYEEVRPWAKAVAKAVESKQMPPWHATPETSKIFRNCALMSDEEVATIKQWVETGARKGNPADAPAPLQWVSTGWNFGEPDLVVGFPEPFLLADDVSDLYHNITVTLTAEQLGEDRWIKAIEFKPGSEVVHHIIGYANESGGAEESADEDGGETTQGMIGGNAPGTDFAQYPDGYGILLKKGSKLTFAMHYHKEAGAGTAKWDSSQIGIKFHDANAVIDHPIDITTVAHGAFEIPPHNGNWRVGAMKRFDQSTMLMGLMPHMHLRGKAAKYIAHYPDGSSELLLDVPKYDFNWQRSYDLAEYKFIPAGTYLEMDFAYDNSDERAKEVGFDSNKAIRFGGPTTDEMDLAWYFASPATQTDIAKHDAGDRHASLEDGNAAGD